MIRPVEGSGWTARTQGTDIVIVLSKDWIARETGVEVGVAERLLANRNVGTVSFDAAHLGRWDSALIVFLWALREKAATCGATFDQSGLPQPARRLLALPSSKSRRRRCCL